MAMAQTPRETRRFTGRHMLIATLSFFGVVIAVNLVLAWFAAGTWTGLVVRNTYVASQDYNRTVEAARTSGSRDWKATVVRGADGLVMRWADADGGPLRGLAVAGVVGRPVQEGEDRAVAFDEAEAGLYRADVVLAPGAWQLVATAVDANGVEVRRILRFTMPARRP